MNKQDTESKAAALRDIEEFDREHAFALQRIWFLGEARCLNLLSEC